MKGRAVILRTDTVITPFGDHVGEVFFSGETIAQTQDRAFRGIGFEVVRAETPDAALAAVQSAPAGMVVLLLDRIYVSEKAARDFVHAARRSPRPSALALSINASVEYTLPLQDVRRDGEAVVHDVVLVDGAKLPSPAGTDPIAWLHAIRDASTPVDVPKREIAIEVPLPVIGEREKATMRYPITSTNVVSIEHWVHVLWLNQIAFGIRWMELLRKKPLWGLWRALTAFSLNGDRLLERFVRRGRGVKVHKTAYLAGSIVGDGATIGAGVTIRSSIIGPGAVIQDHAVILNSVIGPRCLVTENTVLVSCVSYPDATIGNYKLQVSLIGRGAYVNIWAGFVDAKFVGTIKVAKNGALADTQRAFLGSVIGHRAKVAAKVLIQAGREIPNDAVIVMRPDEVVSVVPPSLPAGKPVVRDRGTLVPLGEESRTP